jgi:hypothetical protein
MTGAMATLAGDGGSSALSAMQHPRIRPEGDHKGVIYSGSRFRSTFSSGPTLRRL